MNTNVVSYRKIVFKELVLMHLILSLPESLQKYIIFICGSDISHLRSQVRLILVNIKPSLYIADAETHHVPVKHYKFIKSFNGTKLIGTCKQPIQKLIVNEENKKDWDPPTSFLGTNECISLHVRKDVYRHKLPKHKYALVKNRTERARNTSHFITDTKKAYKRTHKLHDKMRKTNRNWKCLKNLPECFPYDETYISYNYYDMKDDTTCHNWSDGDTMWSAGRSFDNVIWDHNLDTPRIVDWENLFDEEDDDDFYMGGWGQQA